MSERPFNQDPRERLSMLLDGECDPSGAEQACRAWREDADTRATWHAYQLIGDVLRSEDLAHPADRDEAFLGALRQRLAGEPVVLAPAAATPVAPRRRWFAPAAAAAGFAAVAGVLVVTRMGAPEADPAAPTVALAPGPVNTRPVAASMPGAGADTEPPAVIVTDGKLIRDAQLDRYLAAHKQFGGSSAVAVPGTVLRSSATVAPGR
jgi:sigma-E factor negative regulatory protein RseA